MVLLILIVSAALIFYAIKSKKQKKKPAGLSQPVRKQQEPEKAPAQNLRVASEQELDELEVLAKRTYSASTYADRAAAAQSVLDYLETSDTEGINNYMLVNSEETSSYYHRRYCARFGAWFDDGESPLDEYKKSINRDLARESHRAERAAVFKEVMDSIPLVEIAKSDAALPRNKLSDMPEVKYTNVTRAFNPESIPTFIVVDVETNGLKVQGGRVLEISAVKFVEYEPVEAFTTLVNPGKPIPPEATKINGITDDMVADAPTLGEVAQAFTDFIGKYPLVGYNLPFDLKFIYCRGIDIFGVKRKYFDVLPLCKKAIKDNAGGYSLGAMAERCDIFRDSAHRSLSDCITTGEVFRLVVDAIANG